MDATSRSNKFRTLENVTDIYTFMDGKYLANHNSPSSLDINLLYTVSTSPCHSELRSQLHNCEGRHEWQ